MLAVILFNGSYGGNQHDMVAWWGTIYPRFCFAEETEKEEPPWQQQEDSLLIEIAKKAERHVILISPYENSFHVLFCFLL